MSLTSPLSSVCATDTGNASKTPHAEHQMTEVAMKHVEAAAVAQEHRHPMFANSSSGIDLKLATTYVPAMVCLIKTSILIVLISRWGSLALTIYTHMLFL
jgi:hypothetical protein